MKNFLNEIIEKKIIEVEKLKKSIEGSNEFENKLNEVKDKKNHSFIKRIEESDNIVIISEIKRASPSKGNLNTTLDAEERAKDYESAGADAISVLTEEHYFKGNIEDLIRARGAVNLPILRKDFIIDEIQIEEAKIAGADLVLLIVAALEEKRFLELFDFAKTLNLEVLVEVHNEEELDIALKADPKLIGINNRNLKTFNVDLKTTFDLVGKARSKGAFVISESGISNEEQVKELSLAGVSGILVGESLVTSDNFKDKLKSFKVKRG